MKSLALLMVAALALGSCAYGIGIDWIYHWKFHEVGRIVRSPYGEEWQLTNNCGATHC